MKYNRLLKKQIASFLPGELREDPRILALLNKVSESYNLYEKNRQQAERIIHVMDEEYQNINNQLKKKISSQQPPHNTTGQPLEITVSEIEKTESPNLLSVSRSISKVILQKRDTEKLLRSLIDNLDIGIILIEPNGKILFSNDQFCKLFSIKTPNSQLQGASYLPIITEVNKKLRKPNCIPIDSCNFKPNAHQLKTEILQLRSNQIFEYSSIFISLSSENHSKLCIFKDITHKQLAYDALQASEQKNKMILHGSPDATILFDDRDAITFWNLKAERLFEWNEKQVIGKSFIELLFKNKTAVEIKEKIALVKKRNSNVAPFETMARCFSNIEFPAEVSLAPIKLKGKQLYCAFIRNISVRKKSAEQLQSLEHLLQRSQEIAHVGSWEANMINKEVFWTDELFRINGLEPGSVKPTFEKLMELVHPDDRESVKHHMGQSIMNLQPFNMYYRVVRPNGEIRIKHDIGEVVLNEQGNLIKMRGIGQDVTDLKMAEENLALQKKFTEEILTILPAQIFVFNPEGRYLFVNPQAEVDTETRNTLIGKKDVEYLDETIDSEKKMIIQNRLKQFNQAIIDDKITEWIQSSERGGNMTYQLMKMFPYKEDEKLKYVIGYGVDISERKKMELELSKTLHSLHHSNKELEQFAYVISHDLQEPLRMVKSFLELLTKKIANNLGETEKQYINFAVDGADRMRKLILDLLEYSRLSTRDHETERVDCNQIVKSVLNIFELKIQETQAIIHLSTLPTINGVRLKIQQLFQNLIGNALKYRKDNQIEISIGFEELDDEWIFNIQDNGIGIDPKYFEKIFVIFQRLHARNEYEGTGIGLSICKKIVNQHGGKIWVNSKPQEGATFYFSIPKKNSYLL
ncbi:MAG: hypothetical protein RLY16_1364 [Bacteroidota bacterium]